MSRALQSIEIAVTAEQAWTLVGGFDNLPRWLPLISHSQLEDGGRVRRLRAGNGALIVERLLHFDEASHYFRYAHLQAPDPASGYIGWMRVEPLPSKHCRVSWGSEFEPVGLSEAAVIAHFESIYASGLAALKRCLEQAG